LAFRSRSNDEKPEAKNLMELTRGQRGKKARGGQIREGILPIAIEEYGLMSQEGNTKGHSDSRREGY